MTKCKSCGASIIWVTTPNGKMTPVDEKRTRVALLIYDDPPKIEDVSEGHVSHWSTCPNADQHRSKKND